LSYAIGETFGEADEGHVVFDHLLGLFGYQYIFGPNASLDAEYFIPHEEPTIEYPVTMETQIEKRIMEGDTEAAKKLIYDSLSDASTFSPSIARAFIARICATVFSSVEKLERSAEIKLSSASIERMTEIVFMDTMSSAKHRFGIILDEIAILLDIRRSERNGDLLAKADAYIAASYTDVNLSTGMIADKLGLSFGYFGRTYRRIKGKSVADSINETRLAASLDLLRTSNMTIEAVAASVGVLNPSSFYRLLKPSMDLRRPK